MATYLLVMLVCGCSAKRKLTESKVINAEKSAEAQILQRSEQNTLSYSLSIDSAKQTKFFKLYPKGDFIINKNGFQGSADSLIWYNNAQQVSRHQQLEQQHQQQSNSEVYKQVEKQLVKERKKHLSKASFPFWWILAGAALICIVLLFKERSRRI